MQNIINKRYLDDTGKKEVCLGRRNFINMLGLGTLASLTTIWGLWPAGGKTLVYGEKQEEKNGLTVDKITEKVVKLPEPESNRLFSVEKAIGRRRSRREFKNVHITIKALGQLLWAAQGITDKRRGFRAAPSAGALYPMETFVVLPTGVYLYEPKSHLIRRTTEGDKSEQLFRVSLDQDAIKDASINLVITAVYERSSIKYGPRATRYCMIEAGNISENIYLQAESLGLGVTMMGAFHDDQIRTVLGLRQAYRPLLVMPVGVPK